MAIVFDDVDGDSITIGEYRDLLGAGRPAHCLRLAFEGFNKDDSLVGGHVEPAGKYLVIKCIAPFFVDILTQFLQIVNYVVDAQYLGQVGNTTCIAAAAGTAWAAGAAFCKAVTCAWSIVIRAWSSWTVGG